MRDVVVHRVARLGAGAIDVLSAAAVIGHDFDLSVLRAAVDQPADAVLGALDAAEAAHLVGPSVAVGRFAFSHALVADALHQTLSSTRRGALHVRIADALEGAGPPGERASHLLAAGPVADPERVYAATRAAGDDASPNSHRMRPSGGTRRRWPACRVATTPPAPTCSPGSAPRSSKRAFPRSARRCSRLRTWR